MIKDFKIHLENYKRYEKPASTFYHRHFSKNGAKLFTYISLKIGLNPNGISLLSFLLVFVSCYLIAYSSLLVLSLVLLQIAYILDCSAGVVARMTDQGSRLGELIDVSFDRILGCIFSFALFINLSSEYVLHAPEFLYAICLSAYLSYTFLSTLRGYIFTELKGSAKKRKSTLIHKAAFLIYEFIDTGIYYLIMSIALLGGFLDVAIVFYGLLSLPLIGGTYFLCWKQLNEI